jgi:hypothetical protein
MKNNIARQLNEVAKGMPLVYEWHEGSGQWSGSDLNLTPMGDKYKFDPDKLYTISMPYMQAVEHKQQLKDAYKRGGFEEVKKYHRSVMDKITTQ